MISTNNVSNLFFITLCYHITISYSVQLDPTWQELQQFQGTAISTLTEYYTAICDEIGKANKFENYEKSALTFSSLYTRSIDLYPDSESRTKKHYELHLFQCAFMQVRPPRYPSRNGPANEVVQFATSFVGEGENKDDVMEYTEIPKSKGKVQFFKNRTDLLKNVIPKLKSNL